MELEPVRELPKVTGILSLVGVSELPELQGRKQPRRPLSGGPLVYLTPSLFLL